jgi:hypothetical protein
VRSECSVVALLLLHVLCCGQCVFARLQISTALSVCCCNRPGRSCCSTANEHKQRQGLTNVTFLNPGLLAQLQAA